ncbi:hypothetical protein [Gluconobacter cerinus]|uniref:hypothetical protein n=1 Tax=Gluconobacter cerinus TaxID=38307 RepID=UPI001B8C15B5|nr:hypothetical protein [Gluconobacter cerinus]MBS0984137.1 hypothetical protein [Gluconobacter cerinus]
MIVESNPMSSDSSAKEIFSYISENSKNEDVQLLGGSLQDVENALVDAEQFNRKNGIRHFQISSKESLSDEQFLDMIERVKTEFDIADDDVVFSAIHTFKRSDPNADKRHAHFGIRLVNPGNGKVKSFDNLYQRQEKISRMAEVDYGFQLVKGAHNRAVWHHVPEEYKDKIAHLCEGDRPQNTMSEGTIKKLTRLGKDTYEIKQNIKNLFAESQTYNEFKEKIEAKGWTITNGTQKPDMLIMNDENGIFLGSVNRLTSIKKKELDALIASPDIPIDSFIARHIPSDTIAYEVYSKLQDNSPGIASRGPALETSEKPQETDKATIQTKPHNKTEQGSGGASMNVEAEKIATSSDMSQEQKDAINQINKKTVEDEQDIKSLEKRIKERNQILDDLLVPKKENYNIFDSWNKYLNNEKDKNQYIIDLPHPKLNNLDDKKIRGFIYKHFKGELEEFKKEKDKLKSIKAKIKDLDNALLFKGSRQQKAEREQQEQIERMTLLALHLTHLIMYKLGLTKQKPHALNYMTQQQINEYKKQYHHNQYAQTLMKANGIPQCINAIAERKKMEREGVLLDWSEREEVQQAKEVIRKILRIEKLDISEFNQDEHHQYEKLVKDKDINNVNELLTEKNIRISKEEQEQEQDNDLTHENENDKEIEKTMYRKKVKKSGPSFNR